MTSTPLGGFKTICNSGVDFVRFSTIFGGKNWRFSQKKKKIFALFAYLCFE
jgi:hypothetical protein